MSKIDISTWQRFSLGKLFRIEKGSRLTKANMKAGNINFIGASSFNNGVTAKVGNIEHLHPENTITVSFIMDLLAKHFIRRKSIGLLTMLMYYTQILY